MSLATPDQLSDQHDDTGRTDYEKLLAEAQATPEVVGSEDYARVTDLIAQSRAFYKTRVVPSEARALLSEIYVEEEKSPQLKRFATVLIDAPYQAGYQKWIDRHPKNEQTREESMRGRELAYRRCEYNNLVRGVIVDGRKSFDRPTLTEYMNKASDNYAPKFNHRIITGASAEVAFNDALQTMPGMDDVAFTDTQTDFQGTDIMASYHGQPIGFDVKFDKDIARSANKKVGSVWMPHITIGVPVEAIDDLGLSSWGQQHLTSKIDAAVVPEVQTRR